MVRGSSSRSQESHGSSEIVQENDSVYQLYMPASTPSIQVVFFHGLQPGCYSVAHLSTWKCADDSCIWPQTWLVEEIPEAQVFSVSCSGVLRNSSNASIDMYDFAENLISDLLMANIGQVPNCPLVLVGHSIGGLVIKELCCQAHSQLSMNKDFQRTKLEKFLTNLRGVFYFATPHHGSPVANYVADMVGSPLMKYFKTLSTDTVRLNSTFDGISKVYEKWQFAGLVEDSPTDLGWFGKFMVVPEGSVREDNFNVVQGADHFSICRPGSKQSRSFHKLKDFLVHIANEVKDEGCPQNFQHLPKHITVIDGQVEQVEAILKDNRTLGLVGMGGSFGHLSALNHLEFNSCSQLQSLPESFGHLSALNHLEFNWCRELQSLPESFGHLSALNHLEFHDCEKLQSLPESFGHLSALNHVEFHGCDKLQSLPESFGHLSALNHLEFNSCSQLQSLPESFGHLSALNHLEFHDCDKLQSLPESFGHLSALKYLRFKYCIELQSLPKSFGHLSALNYLEFHDYDKLQSLPESFGHLSALNHLEFNWCRELQSLPESFGHLSALNHLEFYSCTELQSLPESFGQLSALSHLEFNSCSQLQSLPESFGHLSALNHLELNWCFELQSLPESFGHLSALKHLRFKYCTKLQSLPESFGHLSALNHLELNWCRELQSLPESFGHLSALKYLRFKYCTELQSLPESFGHLSALNHLEFNNCDKLQSRPESFGYRQQALKLAERDQNEEALTMLQNELQWAPDNMVGFLEREGDKLEPGVHRQRVLDKAGLLAPCVYENTDEQKMIASWNEGFGRREDDAKDCDGIRVIDENDETPALVDSPCRQLLHRAKVRKLALGEDCTAEVNRSSESGHFVNKISVLTITGEDGESHLSNDKVREAQMMQDFLANVDDSNECGYFVSKAWLLGLDEHESEEVMSVLRRNWYLEIFDTETTVWYERMEENVKLLTLHDDPFPTPEEKNSSSEDTSQTLASVESGPALGKIQHIGFNTTKHDGDTIEAKNDQAEAPLLQTTEKLKGIQLESGEASITTDNKLLSSLRKALKDSGRHSYYIRTRWLSSLSSSEMKELNSTLVEAGYSQTYQTSTIAHFERIRAHVLCPSTNHGETTSTSQTGSIVSGVESTSGFQGNVDSLHLQGLKLDDKGSSSVKVESTTSSKTSAKCVCPPEMLTVSVPQGLIGASSSNSQGENWQNAGDCYVTTPRERKGRFISTSLEKDLFIKVAEFDESTDCLKEETIHFKVSARTLVSCCLRRDHDKKVHIDFRQIKGNITLIDPNRSYGMVLKSVLANVSACVRNSEKEMICLELQRDDSLPSSWKRVLKSYQPADTNGSRYNSEDLDWLALSGDNPKNSAEISKSLELECHVNWKLLADISTCSNNAMKLYFVDPPPVIFEGDVYTDFENNSHLELNLRYQVQISHVEPKLPLPPQVGRICQAGGRVIKVVDFDCFLELRTDVLSQD
ncbi:unnamed protein product [Calypogeia fissa]